MPDLNERLAHLQAQLAEARAELEAAQARAREAEDLHEKLKHTTRARAAQDLVSSLEAEIATVRAAIAEAQRQEQREGLLSEARELAEATASIHEQLEGLLSEAEDALTRLLSEAPGLLQEWRNRRQEWRVLTFQLLGFSRPLPGGHIEAVRQQQAHQDLLRELAEAGEVLRLEPGGDLSPGERQWRPARNWQYERPLSARDLVSYVLDEIARR
jgi:DNA repair exonuclease SbcCD ATPase subunit